MCTCELSLEPWECFCLHLPSHCQTPGITDTQPCVQLYVGSGDQNSAPYTCVTSAFPMELLLAHHLKKKSVCHLAQIKDMVLKPYGQTQPIDTFSFSVNNHVPSVYRSAIDLLNPNASLCIFHQYFTWMLCLEKGMVGPMPMSAAPWSQDEGLSERRDCICSCCVESSRVC